MQGNDIAAWVEYECAVIFEGLLASPPEKLIQKQQEKLFRSRNRWEDALRLWTIHELPVKSLEDMINRQGIITEVYTLLPSEAVPAIDAWLNRKGISTNVLSWPDIEALAYDLSFHRDVRIVFTSNQDHYGLLFPKSKIVSPGGSLLA